MAAIIQFLAWILILFVPVLSFMTRGFIEFWIGLIVLLFISQMMSKR